MNQGAHFRTYKYIDTFIKDKGYLLLWRSKLSNVSNIDDQVCNMTDYTISNRKDIDI